MARMISPVEGSTAAVQNDKTAYNRFLLLVAGLGGLLYGVDVGIIAGALPYLEATSGLNAGQLSIVVAAVLLGSVISTLFAGLLADWIGRKALMTLSGLLFVASIPMIALSHGYQPLVLGRLLQGVSAGLVGVVVPLYLAECLVAANRGKGTGIFQWLLTLGIVVAAVVGILFSVRVEQVARLADPARLLAFKDTAWRSIFWVSLPPGILFVMACVILACNQATGINSIIAYNTNILLQSGLSDVAAHWGYVVFTVVNFLVTLGGVMLVDRKGRKFLLALGSAGIIVSLICTGLLFGRTEKLRVDSREAVQSMVTADQELTLVYDQRMADGLLNIAGTAAKAMGSKPTSLIVIYSYGDFRAATKVARSDERAAKPMGIARESCVPANKIVAFFSNPFGNLDAARQAPLRIENAQITPVPSTHNGWWVAITLFVFMAFFAIGPGVCVWLALSELMPTRIRSNGMSIALLINQAVSTTIAAIFLPTVGRYGYSTMFFAFAGCTVIYFITATVFLPETKGKTLEEIEAHFEASHT